MSLRPDDDRKGSRTSRSRSRTRDRSVSRDGRSSSAQPKVSTSKDARKARFADDPNDEPSSKSAAEVPRYEVRKPSSVTPGLSSLAAAHGSSTAEGPDSDEDSDEPPPKPLTRAATFPEPASASRVPMPMPAFPTMPEFDRPLASPTSPVPTYPTKAGVYAFPPDATTGYAMMPKADYTAPYATPEPYRYAQPPEKLSYSTQAQTAHPPVAHTPAPQRQFSTSSIPRVPSSDSARPASSRSSSYTYNTEIREARPRDSSKRESVDRTGKSLRIGTADPSAKPTAPQTGLAPQDGRLLVAGDRSEMGGSGRPPASPLLEAYQGTYQSMPSPMLLPSRDTEDMPSMSLLSLNDTKKSKPSVKISERAEKPQKKHVKIYDAEEDADALATALGHSVARPGPLIEVLPDLTHDQLLKLRDEYKKKYKVQGRGVNIAKHIKMKTTGNFGKICFVTALGKWESESYWANFWYQSRSSSRELLIEALMGRTNAEIREIKDSFRDRRYDDSLSRCMERELKADKFRSAILMALEAKRQEETDAWPTEYRDSDVETLHRALSIREGGESAILEVVVKRSDNHLREVLRAYEEIYKENFARVALKKSNNLVVSLPADLRITPFSASSNSDISKGEVIAHILNGCINRPARDALLLCHAIDDLNAKSRTVDLRYELLMSRLIRLHWDRLHLAKVKVEYRKKYGSELEEDLEDATKGEFGEFCLRLAET